MPAKDSPDYYRFVACPKVGCGLRFPGVVGVACPLCKTPTEFVSERCAPPGPESLESPELPPLELFLDNVRSVFNVGSIFRTAEGCGVQQIYLSGISPTPSHAAMKKTALGAEQEVPWSQHNNGVLLAQELVAAGRRLWALELTEGSVDLFAHGAQRPADLVLVLGNEVTGVDPGILQLCEQTLHIPMRGCKASLNVATAVGIAAYALR